MALSTLVARDSLRLIRRKSGYLIDNHVSGRALNTADMINRRAAASQGLRRPSPGTSLCRFGLVSDEEK